MRTELTLEIRGEPSPPVTFTPQSLAHGKLTQRRNKFSIAPSHHTDSQLLIPGKALNQGPLPEKSRDLLVSIEAGHIRSEKPQGLDACFQNLYKQSSCSQVQPLYGSIQSQRARRKMKALSGTSSHHLTKAHRSPSSQGAGWQSRLSLSCPVTREGGQAEGPCEDRLVFGEV